MPNESIELLDRLIQISRRAVAVSRDQIEESYASLAESRRLLMQTAPSDLERVAREYNRPGAPPAGA